MEVLGIFDFLQGIEIDPRLVIAMVGLGQYLKSIDKSQRFLRFYGAIPMVLALIVAIFISSTVLEYLMNAFIYLGINVCFYNLVWKVLVAFCNRVEASLTENKNDK